MRSEIVDQQKLCMSDDVSFETDGLLIRISNRVCLLLDSIDLIDHLILMDIGHVCSLY